MSQAVADKVKGRVNAVAVSDAYKLAPWADLLVSTDGRWWKHHPEAIKLQKPKFAATHHWSAVNGVESCLELGTHVNSGLLACHIAIKYGATKLLLLGFDFRPGHFFGDHPEPLKNTTSARYEVFQKQFEGFRPLGVEIVNCTQDSGLRAYPMKDLDACLGKPSAS